VTPAPARVLYIDDDEGLRRLVSRALDRRGYAVTTAPDGPSGVAAARAGPFDLIAVDHYMPGQDGLATLAALRALPTPPPVVYVTGSEESRIAVAALKAGAVDYVVKTIGEDFFDLLASAFDQALDQISLRRGKAEAEAELRAANERLQTLLKEVNHRVANSLQLVSAFVRMQASALPDETAREALKDTQRRIEAIIQVHRSLYTSDAFDAVSMDDYLGALLSDLEEAWSTPHAPRRLLLSAPPARLQTDKAVSLGVIVNELVSNACKYAYPADAAGEIRVALNRNQAGLFELIVEDDGCGLPDDAAPKGTGLGARLVGAMAASLHSTMAYEPTRAGVRARLVFEA
jgi:two-component sensor histidine kinase